MAEIMLRIVPDVQGGDGSRTPVRGISSPSTTMSDGKTIGIINNLDKNISELSKRIKESTDKNEVKQLSSEKRGLEKEKSKMTDLGLMGGLGGMGGIASMVLGIGALVEIVKALFDVFKPVQSLIQAILKTLGMFLQPIAEVLVIMLRPILDLLRPVLMIFRAMLMPVMGTIRELGQLMSAQVSRGEMPAAIETGAVMSGLFSAALFTGLATMIGNLMVDSFFGAIEWLLNGLIDLMYGLIRPVIDVFAGKETMASIDTWVVNLKAGISNGLDTAKDAIKSKITSAGQAVMTELVNAGQSYLEAHKGDLETTWGGIVEPFETVSSNTIAALNNETTGLPAITNAYKKSIEEILGLFPKEEQKKNMPPAYYLQSESYENLTSSFDTTWNAVESLSNTLSGGGGGGGARSLTTLIGDTKDELIKINEPQNNFKLGISGIADVFKKMIDVTASAFDIEGPSSESIPKSYKDGLDTIHTITDTFGDEIEKTAVKISNAAAKVRNSYTEERSSSIFWG